MALYDPAVYPNQRGWGQMLPMFQVGSAITFVDAAKNGRSSKSFYDEGAWAAVRTQLLPGDHVLIQFAHNDEKGNGLDQPAGVGTAPFGTYQDYLRKYVDETVAAGATPILVTPIVRRYFSGTTISPKGAHDLTGVGDPSIPVTQDLNYVEAMKQVATEKGCLLVDMTTSTRALVEQYGPSASKSALYVATDDTHLNPIGATLFAQLAVQEMIARGILAGHLTADAGLMVTPAALDFGTTYVGRTQDQVISVAALSLTPDAGNVTVTAPDGFVTGLAGGTFASTLRLPYTGGKLAPSSVTVRFQPGEARAYSGTLTVAPDSGAGATVALAGVGVATATGGTDATVTWDLTSAATAATCTAAGPVACTGESFSGLYAKSYAVPNATSTTWIPSTPSSTVTQRISIVNPTTADQWPGSEIDVVADRHVQFALTPAPGRSLAVDQITLWAGAAGGSSLGFRIQYSLRADFSGAVTLFNTAGAASNTMTLQTFTPVLTVADGQTLYVRVFPWWSGKAATGKYLCLQSLTIHGVAP
jgi:lysophospholipase L1-like esterase